MARIVSKGEAAKLLGGVSTKTVDRLRADGELASLCVRGRVMVLVESIDRYLERQLSVARCQLEPASAADIRSHAKELFPIPALGRGGDRG